MKKIDKFIHQYPVSKTLRFSLIPQGKTAENFDANLLLEEDEERAKNYKIVKGYIDQYHKKFIEEVLNDFELKELLSFADLYYKLNKTIDERAALDKLSTNYRKEIAKAFSSDKRYKDLFSKEMIRQYLPEMLTKKEELDILHSFYDFTTYFTGFHENRKNMYSEEEKSTSIAYRLINQNLPRFLDNCKIGRVVLDTLSEDVVRKMSIDLAEKIHVNIDKIFDVEFFNEVLSQSGIDTYNQMIGGYTTKDGKKIKGINECINEYNQTTKSKLPKLRPLYKQILSDRSSFSFIPEKFSTSQEVLDAINSFLIISNPETGRNGMEVIIQLKDIISKLQERDLNGIYVSAGSDITDVSNNVFGNWSIIRDGLEKEYDAENGIQNTKNIEKYIDRRNKYFKSIKSFSLAELQHAGDTILGDDTSAITEYYKLRSEELLDAIESAYEKAESLLTKQYSNEKKLFQQDEDVELIKMLLDSIKDFQRFSKTLLGSGAEEEKDFGFYADYSVLYDQLDLITPLYNKVRDYVTQKPYSNEKIKLNFNNAQLLGGWDRNKEADYTSVIFVNDGYYYLGIMDKKSNKAFESIPLAHDGETIYKKMVYKLLPGPNKMLPKVFFSKKGLGVFCPSKEIQEIYARESFKSGPTFNLHDCHKLIDFYKEAISQHDDWKQFGFDFCETQEYKNIGQFYKDVKDQGYKIWFEDVPESYINKLVGDGKLYLFQIYNKDFSPYSKGTPNLHTIYFRLLFNEINLRNNVIWLNGGAEMFYRKASISKDAMVVHSANKPIQNKNPLNSKKESLFTYDLVKDKRYTQRSFSLHVPIQINPTGESFVKTNENVRYALRGCENNYVIGIDRGERNLLYIVVIDGKGNIVEQHSLNSIINEYNGVSHAIDYHALLDSKEKERKKARQDWKQIGNIKNIKEGYISQVIHVICQLVDKYDAVIAMEDLNFGFKNVRGGVEKSVYQKFEKMLIDKLNLCVFKDREPEEIGGALCGYQLTEKFESFRKMGKQNGFIFYVPAWNTSKIDPTTGFVNLLNTKYESVDAAKKFFSSFDSIKFNKDKDYFEFDLDYSKFPRGVIDYQKKWPLTTYGTRIRTFRNESKNSEWDSESVDLTETFKKVLEFAGIDYSKGNLKDAICSVTNKDFYVKLLSAFSLMLQMRNSITGTDIDYLASPVMNEYGKFFNTNEADEYPKQVPVDADANGAYNIARKGLWAIEQINSAEECDINHVKLAMTNAQWLEYAQTHK